MKRRNLLIAAIAHFIVAVVLVVALFSLSACFIIGQYPPEFSYPMEMEGEGYGDGYYVDVDFVPVYGVAIYYRLGPSYPYYYYHGGYGYYSYGRYYYRYYRVWTWGSVPYYWNNGSYVQIYETNYYSYDVTVNQWHSNPVPESYSYGAPASSTVPPKPGVGGPKHYEAYPPVSPKPSEGGPPGSNKSHPVVRAIPKNSGQSAAFDHTAYPPSEVGPNAPKPPQNTPTITGLAPGVLQTKPPAQKLNTPFNQQPKIIPIETEAAMAGKAAQLKSKPSIKPTPASPYKPQATNLKSFQTKPSLKPSAASPYKPNKPVSSKSAYMPKSPATHYKSSATTYKSNIQKKSVKPYHPPAKTASHKSASLKQHHPKSKVKH